MQWLRRIEFIISRHAAIRFACCTALAILVWIFSSKGLQDALVYAAFLFAIFHAKGSSHVWKQPAGIAFILAGLYSVFTIPFSAAPDLSLRDLLKFMELIAGMFAISVIFNTREKLKAPLFYSALAINLALAFDLLRLSISLKHELLLKAHSFQPFILNHSNVASMMAGLSFFVFLYFFWIWRHKFWAALGCGAALAVSLLYQFVVACRGPQIAFALCCCFAGFILPRWKNKLIFFILVFIIGLIFAINIQHINPRFLEKASMATFSDRDKVWGHTCELVKEKPLFGYGFGKKNFVREYYSTNPPQAAFHFPHTHQFWLKLLFEFGIVGLAVHFIAWVLLAVQLAKAVFWTPTFRERALPGTVALMLLFIHLYGLGDYPDNIVRIAQFWLIPLALVMIASNDTKCPEKVEGTPAAIAPDDIWGRERVIR